MASKSTKKRHSGALSALLIIAHVLPLACKSVDIVQHIFTEKCTASWGRLQNFHARWILVGWNDHIIQSAQDAVLDYYKVHTPKIYTGLVLKFIHSKSVYSQRYAELSDVKEYIRCNNLS